MVSKVDLASPSYLLISLVRLEFANGREDEVARSWGILSIRRTIESQTKPWFAIRGPFQPFVVTRRGKRQTSQGGEQAAFRGLVVGSVPKRLLALAGSVEVCRSGGKLPSEPWPGDPRCFAVAPARFVERKLAKFVLRPQYERNRIARFGSQRGGT